MSTPQSPFSATALARFRAVSLVEHYLAQGDALGVALERAAREPLPDASGKLCSRSIRTLRRWMTRYTKGGVAALSDPKRPPLQGSRAFSQALLDFCIAEHASDLLASVPELIRRARAKGILHPEQKVRPGSLWRVLTRMNLEFTQRPTRQEREMRRFAHTERMQCVLVDGKHFKVGTSEVNRVALYFLDDATRYGLTVVVGKSESAELFLRGFYVLLRRFGKPVAMFADHGSAFVNETALQVFAKLNIPFIHGAVGHPEGRGKIERFNRSAKQRVLRALRGNPAIDPDCKSLELRLQHDLEQVYNRLPHEAHEDHENQTPEHHWMSSSRSLIPLSDESLLDAFTLPLRRIVSKDNLIKLDGRLIELPIGYARREVTVFRRPLEDNAIYLLHHGKLIRLQDVDTALNANTRRAPHDTSADVAQEPIATASTLVFERDIAPILDADGGFSVDME